MNSELEPTCWRKHSKKFSSVGRIWASCGEDKREGLGGTRQHPIPGVCRASTAHLRHLDLAVRVFVVLAHELLHLLAQVVFLGVLPARRADGSAQPPPPRADVPPILHLGAPEPG